MELKQSIVLSTDGKDSRVEFTFDDNTKSVQTISNLSIDNSEVLNQELTQYAEAYLAGKELESKAVEAGLVGKVLTPVIPETITPTLPIDPVI